MKCIEVSLSYLNNIRSVENNNLFHLKIIQVLFTAQAPPHQHYSNKFFFQFKIYHQHIVTKFVNSSILTLFFRCLHRTGGVLYRKPDRACQIVEACARLHNLCIDRNVQAPEEPIVERDEGQPFGEEAVDLNAAQFRQRLVLMF